MLIAIRKIYTPILLLLLLSVGLFFVMKLFLVPELLAIQDNFSYSADLISLNNFYDENTISFQGEKRSVSNFLYKVSSVSGERAQMNAVYDVRSLEGDSIFEINNEYTVNKITYTHSSNDENIKTHLFGPRNAVKGESFMYQHVSFDDPVEMKFMRSEYIEGILVYVYESNFLIDQTDQLVNLDDVPEEKGVNADVNLKLWIEPVSGWLVKFEDNAVGYFYDQETGERLSPWNSFSNRYSKKSIHNQVQKAKNLKYSIIFLQYLLPLLFFIIAISILIYFSTSYDKRNMVFVIFVILTFLILYAFFYSKDYVNLDNVEKHSVLVSDWLNPEAAAHQQNIQGFIDALDFAGYKKDVNINYEFYYANANPRNQKSNTDQILVTKHDLVYVLTSKAVKSLSGNLPASPLIFSAVTYPIEHGFISSLRGSGNNLVGVRNWVSPSRIINILRQIKPDIKNLAFIRSSKELDSPVQYIDFISTPSTRDINIIEVVADSYQDAVTQLDQLENLDAVYTSCDPTIHKTYSENLSSYAIKNKLISFSCNEKGVMHGDLFTLVVNHYEMGRLAGEKAALILQGATPSSLDTSTVSIPVLSVNLVTAELIGIDIPQSVLIDVKNLIK